MQVKAGPRPGDMIDMKLLVLCPHRQDPNLTTLCTIMDYIGMRYDVLATSTADLSADRLWQGSHARYQGIILSTGYFAQPNSALSDWYDPLDDDEWQALHEYQARFGIRLASFCGIPRVSVTTNALVVHEPAGMDDAPLELTLADAGREVFWYLQGDCRIPVYNATAIGVTPLTVASAPLLEGADGLTYGAIWTTGEGCEYLALTVGHSPRALHSLLLGYGVLNWVTNGLFLGQRKVSLNVQIDDIFTSNRLWDQCTGGDDHGQIYRLTEGDVNATVQWLNRVQRQRNCRQMTLNFAYNGAAATPIPVDKAAVDTFVANRKRFNWINHGYTHLLLDDASHADSLLEIQHNQETARCLGLMPYDPDCMVTADMSGLTNPSYLGAAAESGVRFLVCDTSRPGWNNPAPNQPIASAIQPTITMIPRHPNNLFYNVAAPGAWEQQYNQIYQQFWQRNLACAEIIDAEACQILNYLCAADWDPLMFHQANLAAYDGTRSLLSDLLDAVLDGYNRYYGDVPILCPSMRTIGEMMVERAVYNQARINASLVIGSGLVLLSDRDVTVPLTGVRIHGADEQYGGQTLARFALKAHTVRSVPIWDLVGYNRD
ncbi:MAG: hypothetical protein U0X20_05315 [Caldilineaceae bacterium]